MKQVTIHVNGRSVRFSWWQVALIAIAASGISRLTASHSSRKSTKFYTRELKQAPWAPPGWLFGPAWTINNYFLIMALLKIIAMNKGRKKTGLLVMQFFIWTIFYSFDYVYFRKKSPILAAIWTKTDFFLALTSLLITRKTNKKLATDYLPLTLWTLYAGTVADYQQLYNSDPVFKTKPLLSYLKKI